MKPHDCLPGRRATVTLTVAPSDTAKAIGSGDVDVLATPRVLAIAEEAAVRALGDCVPPGQTSVGSWVEIEHRAPSRIDDEVTAEAVLLGVHGRRLEFSISVRSGVTEVAHCRHRRIVVDRESFDRR
jgi:fluoroacetyl-CoA thioesterase